MEMTVVGAQLLPLLLDHFHKITVIHNTLKDRPKSKAVMSTEGCREPYDGNFVCKFWSRNRNLVRMLDLRIKPG